METQWCRQSAKPGKPTRRLRPYLVLFHGLRSALMRPAREHGSSRTYRQVNGPNKLSLGAVYLKLYEGHDAYRTPRPLRSSRVKNFHLSSTAKCSTTRFADLPSRIAIHLNEHLGRYRNPKCFENSPVVIEGASVVWIAQICITKGSGPPLRSRIAVLNHARAIEFDESNEKSASTGGHSRE